MFCNQCEQTSRTIDTIGCISVGTCGKNDTAAALQDVLIHMVKGLAQHAWRARSAGIVDRELDAFLLYAVFTTLTNVNFNPVRLQELIQEAARWRSIIDARYADALPAGRVAAGELPGPAAFEPAADRDGLLAQAALLGPYGSSRADKDVLGLQAFILYGMKGVAAYGHHARRLGYQSDAIDARIEEMFAYLAGDPADKEDLLAHALEVGRLNLSVMELLDAANTGTFGAQAVTSVRVTPVKGRAILVSGHDFEDLARILEATKDQGIQVYTHGEMLPAHAYPELKRHGHLAGNWGGAWQDQQRDFAAFPGPIVMTSNCLIEPAASYRNRIFTTGPVGWPGVRHLAHGEFAEVVKAAKATPGFTADGEDRRITVGFGRHVLMGVADQVVAAVKKGDIGHFFLVGGCDGASPARRYFTEVATKAPENAVILTLGCGKFRFNKESFGDIGGIPRLLDVGQCSDAFSAIQVAAALAGALQCELNDLPLSYMISWFEQKATAVLLSLLALGIKGIYWGPALPGYMTENLVGEFASRFGLRRIGDVDADLQAALN
ncbi:MAG: hydroxylamine reductase [Gammaproteobacteria bacterium]|nr:hydroxylamine reductase [Gammaproteobacteria bacterium]